MGNKWQASCQKTMNTENQRNKGGQLPPTTKEQVKLAKLAVLQSNSFYQNLIHTVQRTSLPYFNRRQLMKPLQA